MSDDAELMTQAAEQEDAHLEELAEEPTETSAAQATLIVKRGGVETEDAFTFSPPAVIGRFDPSVGPVDIDLGSLPEGQYVSRKHAKITFEAGAWTIQDLGSSNGTYLLREDFERVESAPIEDGDEIALGNARFVFRLP
ncbi:MAG: FHA domain-containing protein [Fimbriimonadaceae bacterium]|nr:FHA domain-containing protein [Fimbriimonadaceae bacterium]QYK58186.1 MAG: FHA domain-containing protein [Fimbriimonadaceae bacterium]